MVFKKGNDFWRLRKKPIKDKSIMIPCGCGCGTLIHKFSNQEKERKYAQNHYNRTKEFRDRQSKFMKARKISEETRMKMAHFGEKNNFYGKHHTEEIKKKRSEYSKRFWGNPKNKDSMMKFWNNPKNREKQHKIQIEVWQDKTLRKKMSNFQKKRFENLEERKRLSILAKKRWQNPEYAEKCTKAILQGLMKRPTSFEQKISDLCFKHNLPFVYRGNGSFLINYKNPDFVDEKDKIVIEVFYSWFKIRDYGSVENYKEFCRNKYEPAGWKVIFIDELDLSGDNWEKVCLNKINLL